jgi:conjugal transfer pilus assembly protein TraF
MKNRLHLFLIALLLPSCVFAQDAIHSSSNQQGWFWYDDPAFTEQAPLDEKQPTTEVLAAEHTPATGYSTSWIRENLPKLRDAAIDDPSPEKVRAYLYVQRLAMDRASEFQSTVAFVTEADPYLDQVARFPTSEGGAAIGGRRADNEKEALLFDISKQTGIWFFYRSDCQYCHAMVPVLMNLKRQFGFTIMPISLDGLPLDPRLPNFATDQGQASFLGVEVTPSIFLVRPPNMDDVVPIAQGFVPMSDIETRIVRMAYYHGWITKEQYAKTRIVNPLNLQSTDDLDESNNPAEIVRQLRPNADSTGFRNTLQPHPR